MRESVIGFSPGVYRSLPSSNDFYTFGKKRVPRNLRLNPISLAVWFMDDGSKSRRSCYLNTQQFSDEDRSYLVEVLRRDFGLIPASDKDKQYRRLRFSVDDTKRLVGIISPHVIDSMYYKFPI